MTTISGRAQDQMTLGLLCHSGAGLLRVAAYGCSDDFLGLSQVLWIVFEKNVLDVPPQKET